MHFKEAHRLADDPPLGCSAQPRAYNLFEWRATIVGPPGTPYDGGVYNLKMKFPEAYPFSPPVVSFLTKIFHCNVADNGVICADVLGDDWVSCINVASILLNIRSLMPGPNPYNALSPDVARVFMHDRAGRDSIAKELARKYASAPVPPQLVITLHLGCRLITRDQLKLHQAQHQITDVGIVAEPLLAKLGCGIPVWNVCQDHCFFIKDLNRNPAGQPGHQNGSKSLLFY